MEPVRVQIGAHLDSSWNQIFQPFEASAARARVRVAREMQSLSAIQRAVAAERANAEIKEAERAAAAKVRAEKQAAQESLREWERRRADRARAREREERDILRTAERAVRAEEKERQRRFGAVGGGAIANVGAVYSRSVGVAGQVARGMGVNFDLASSIQKSVDLQKRAIDLSNSAYQPGTAGASGVRQDPRALMEQARSVGLSTAMDPGKVLEGLQAFAGSTGDLETGRAIIADLAKLARATGTEMDVMVQAAGEASKTLGDTPNKAEKTLSVMRAIAAQGKVGAVEIKDMAKYLGKVAAGAPQFEGSVEQNIVTLGALAQLARQRGGASSAAEAATAASGFVNTLKTPARLKQFTAAGIDVIDKKTGQLRDPTSIILASLAKAGDDPIKFKKLFANIQGAKGVEALRTVYAQAGGGQKGLDAAKAELDKYAKTSMGMGEIQDSFAKSMDSTEAKAQQFQNRLDQISASLADRLLPTFEKLAPMALQASEGLAKLVSWAAENPGTAIASAIGASIAKAAIGDVFSKALTTGLSGAGGKFSVSLASAVITIALAELAIAAVKAEEKAGVQAEQQNLDNRAKASSAEERAAAALAAGKDVDPQTKKELAQQWADVTDKITGAKRYERTFGTDGKRSIHDKVMAYLGGYGFGQQASDAADAGGIGNLYTEEKSLAGLMGGADAAQGEAMKLFRANFGGSILGQVMDMAGGGGGGATEMKDVAAKLGGTLKVHVVNAADIKSGGNLPGRVP